jgi:hypothetical protein
MQFRGVEYKRIWSGQSDAILVFLPCVSLGEVTSNLTVFALVMAFLPAHRSPPTRERCVSHGVQLVRRGNMPSVEALDWSEEGIFRQSRGASTNIA